MKRTEKDWLIEAHRRAKELDEGTVQPVPAEVVRKKYKEKEWAAVVKRRLAEMRSGSVEAIPGDEVFEKIWKRFES